LNSKISFEILWWIITAIIVVLILLPIYLSVGDDFPFYRDNMLMIIIGVTFMRYIFLLKHHWLTLSNYIKAVFIVIPIPVFFFLIGAFYDYQSYYDDGNFAALLENLHVEKQKSVLLYIRTEMIFFWVFAFVSNFILPFRMLMSIWRKINKGTE